MERLNLDDIKQIIHSLKTIMDENRSFLIELDSAMGDGDLGITMTNAFSAADLESEKSDENIPGKFLMKLGMTIAKAAPSTMGTLIATGFMRGGKAIGENSTIGLNELQIFLEAFVQGIMERGKSKPGNKTIIDTLNPAAISLTQANTENKQLKEAVLIAFTAAQKGLED